MRLQQVIRQICAVALLMVTLFIYPRLAGATAADAPKRDQGVTSIDVSIATSELGDKDLVRGIYIYHLKCAGSCELNRITLNQCSAPENAESGFVPRVDYWSSARWIKAKQTASNRVELTIYQAFEHGLPAKMTWIFNSSGRPFTTLQELRTSGFIDYREFPKKIVPIEFVPVQADRLKTMDCPARLIGLHS